MAENYMEEILDRRFYKEYADKIDLGSFFQGPRETSNCNIGETTQKFFKLNINMKCLFVSMNSNSETFTVSASKTADSKREKIGIIKYEKMKFGQGTSSIEVQPGITLWLPPEQQVFAKNSLGVSISFLSGPSFLITSRTAVLRLEADNITYSVLLSMSPGKQQIIAQDKLGIRIIYSAVVGKRAYAE